MMTGMDDRSECYLITGSRAYELISWCQDSATARAKRKDGTCVLEADLHKNGHTNSANGAMLLGYKLLTGEVEPNKNKGSDIVHCELKQKEEKKYE